MGTRLLEFEGIRLVINQSIGVFTRRPEYSFRCLLPKYFICVGYGHKLIYAVLGDKIMLGCISLYVLHVVWCLFLYVLLQQVQQCRTQQL